MPARDLAANVHMLVLDVDGVFTDGGLYYDHEGRITKRFNVQDGLGVKLAQSAGLELAVITGLDHGCVSTRVRELGVTYYYPGKYDKIPQFERLVKDSGIAPEHMAYLGDDWVDVAVMRRVGLAMAVANALPEVKAEAAWVSERMGGHGAVREAIDFILECRGLKEKVWLERTRDS